VAESGRRGSVPVEGGYGGVAVPSGAVLWPKAERRGEVTGATLEQDEKYGVGWGRGIPAGGGR
jgi:hypothetical protein